MSALNTTGFVIDGEVSKYDYNNLANKPTADSTLTQDGAFADAAETGKRISQKANNTNDIPLVWTANKTILRDGRDRDQNNVYATLNYIPVEAGQTLEIKVYCPGSADNIVFYDSAKHVVEYINTVGSPPKTYTVTVDGYMRLSNSPSQIPTANTYVKITNAEYPSIMNLQGQITANDDKTVGLLSGADYTYNFEWTDNGYINSNNGVSSNASFIYTPDYYPVIPGAVLDVNLYAVGASDVAVTFYNASKAALSPRVYTYGGQITVPQDAAFMRCSNNITQIPKNEAYVKIHVQNVPNLRYFNIDRDTDILGETVKKTYVSAPVIRKTYKGNINRQKRFLAIGFDDLRSTDISMIMPLFEKYRARATFNKVFNYSDANPTDKAKTWRVFLGDHELGDHTFHHYAFPYFDPLWNGQDPANPDGNQVPFPTNDDFRADAGDGKNVFGKTLTANVNIGDVSGVTWANLTDAQCQTIREAFSVMKNSALIGILDPLYNKYFGTTGTSAGSWDSTTGKYTGGIYTGCSTSANHEVWERINECISAYVKCELGINWDMYTWSRPGTNASGLRVTYDGNTYYDPAHQYLASPQSRFISSITGKARSWTDVLLACGYKVSHDYPIYGDLNYKWMSRQMFFNASLSKPNAISTPTSKSVSYSQIVSAYPESYFSGTKSKAAQMFDTDGEFRNFILNTRKDTANGMIHMEMIDSNDNYSFRVFFENVLRYCEVAGIEVITKAEAYDIAFNNIVSDGNLIGNTELRNTAAEFITDSTNMPTNPDGYVGTCSVTVDDNGIPVLVTGGNTDFVVFGVPYGKIKYTADVKGTGTIKFYGCKNNVNTSAGYNSLMLLGTLSVDSASDYTHQALEFIVPKAELQEYEPNYEGYVNRIAALKIVYSTGLNIKNIRAEKA